MLKSIIHAGGESTRLKEVFDGPKALAPVDKHTLLWFHLQPLLRSGLIKEYVFTLRHHCEAVQNYLKALKWEFRDVSIRWITEPKPLGRAGSVKLAIEKGIVHTDEAYIMSNPDDLVPINIGHLAEYASDSERRGKSVIMVMARNARNPFGIGTAKKTGRLLELEQFQEKPELPLIEKHFANTGMMLFLPDAMEEFRKVASDKPSHPEDEIIPRLVKQNKVAVFAVDRWIPVNYAADLRSVSNMDSKELLRFLNVWISRAGLSRN
jgi:NDP-sugar pyrophosphorylase family protein